MTGLKDHVYGQPRPRPHRKGPLWTAMVVMGLLEVVVGWTCIFLGYLPPKCPLSVSWALALTVGTWAFVAANFCLLMFTLGTFLGWLVKRMEAKERQTPTDFWDDQRIQEYVRDNLNPDRCR